MSQFVAVLSGMALFPIAQGVMFWRARRNPAWWGERQPEVWWSALILMMLGTGFGFALAALVVSR